MQYICKCEDNSISIRKMMDIESDYDLLVKWLSDPCVLDYYEGRSNPYNLDKVMEKFAPRARGLSRVIPCIIECREKAIGYIQYYKIKPGEYSESELIDMSEFLLPYGIDIVIGETDFWNKGLGTSVIKMVIKFLFETVGVDILFIDPQTWNKRAIRCYEKSGFKPITVIKERELHDGELKDSLIMYITPNGRDAKILKAYIK